MLFADVNNDGILDVVCPGNLDLIYFSGRRLVSAQVEATLKAVQMQTLKFMGRP
jgi:hypothetical protein